MASTWKLVRGVKQNRVKRARWSEKHDPSPQRAKRKAQQSSTAGEQWTSISMSIKVADLLRIDARADELGMSRSAYLVLAGLTLADAGEETE